MNRVTLFACLFTLMASLIANSQIAGSMGPTVAPVGCPIKMSITNDTAATIGTGACYYSVYDAVTGAPVYAPFICIFIWLPIGPGQTLTTDWPQITTSGAAVPPGQYTVNISLPSGAGTYSSSLTIVPATPSSAAIATLGAFRSGKTRHFDLWAPSAANHPYLVLASASVATGVPTCAGLFPLDYDFLLVMSLNYNTGVFQNTYNSLDAFGSSQLPAIAIPAGVSGVSFNVAFVTIDPTQPCGLSTMSAAEPITIL